MVPFSTTCFNFYTQRREEVFLSTTISSCFSAEGQWQVDLPGPRALVSHSDPLYLYLKNEDETPGFSGFCAFSGLVGK